MRIKVNIKGLSTIALILLIILSAIIGGLISYAFTIAYYAKIPEEATLAITGVYINKENVRSFNVSVLNPSYSPSDVIISKIAISLKNGIQLYDVVETNPSIDDGLEIRSGESINIMCQKIRKENKDVGFGEFVSTFAGETIFVHVLAERTEAVKKISAANMEATLPLVKLDVTADFDHKTSFKKFNITLTNSPQSEVNLTITSIVPGLITVEQMDPDVRSQPVIIPINESRCFNFNGSWYGTTKIRLTIHTEQGYEFHRDIEMKTVWALIQSVNFNESRIDHFNVTVYNFAESADSVNVERIECTLENRTKLAFDCGSALITPNSTRAFTFDWNWREYRGKNVTIIAHFAQDFEAPPYVAVTPLPVIVKVLNVANAFDLKDKKSFKLIIQNHVNSLEAINLTKIMVKETGQILDGLKVDPPLPYGLIYPSISKTFSCTFDWADFIYTHSRNLTLMLYVTTNETLSRHEFEFAFTLPAAELEVTAITYDMVGETRYLNLTVKNSKYSTCNLTLSKIVITIQDLVQPIEYLLPKNQTTLNVDGEIVLLCPFDWQKHGGKDITVTIVTEELVEVSITHKTP